MSEGQFLRAWRAGVAIAAVVVAAVATLLLAIIGTARAILGHAERAETVAKEIVTNTRPIWALEQTNAVAIDLLTGARAIEEHATAIADALDAPPGAKPA